MTTPFFPGRVAGKSVPPRPPFLEMSDEYWDLVLDRNLKTTYLCCKVVLPEMVRQRYGKVVNIFSYSEASSTLIATQPHIVPQKAPAPV